MIDMLVKRSEEVSIGISQLLDQEKLEIKAAVRSGWHGGDPLRGGIKVKAVAIGLAYKSTGRLRADVWHLFR